MPKTIDAFFARGGGAETPVRAARAETRAAAEDGASGRRRSAGARDGGSRFSRCPICGKDVPVMFLATHADGCEGARAREETTERSRGAEMAATASAPSAPNAFESMMAAQKERERVRVFALTFDASVERWRATVGKSAPTVDATWSNKVVLKEKLSSGVTCTTSLKLVTDFKDDLKLPGHDRAIIEAIIEAREVMDAKAKRAAIVGQEEQLKTSVIKSALQKNIRRGRAVAASRVATHMCLSPDSFVECVRRLVIISLEDAILHPEVPILTWLMCATSKGFEPSDAMRACVIRIAGEMAAINVKDKVSYGAAAAGSSDTLTLNDVESQLSTEESTIVQSLIIRAHFGGMSGDVAMLHGYSRIWLQRFKENTCNTSVPLDYDSLRNSEIIEESENKSQWLSYLELTHEAARESSDAEATFAKWGGFMRREDIPIAAVDFHVSNCVESVLQAPTIRLKIVDIGKELGFGDDMNVTDAVKSAIWRHSAGLNLKVAIEPRETKKLKKEKAPGERGADAKQRLSLAIWDVIKDELERWVKRYLAFRMPR